MKEGNTEVGTQCPLCGDNFNDCKCGRKTACTEQHCQNCGSKNVKDGQCMNKSCRYNNKTGDFKQ